MFTGELLTQVDGNIGKIIQALGMIQVQLAEKIYVEQ